ncbi:MAG: hypothetical protein JWM56_439 [Candidatus Peribacteria bacterium]|nr:hypothetical protein [Candidatus Peribacteria bacterium]
MLPVRRRLLPFSLLIYGGTIAVQIAYGSPYVLPEQPPANFAEIQALVSRKESGGTDGPIATALAGAMCGGTAAAESIGTGGQTKIPTVRGVPGRAGLPLDNVLSGMATRAEKGGTLNDGYQFPEDATGFTTACQLNVTDKTVKRYVSFLGTEVDVEYPHVTDPICKNFDDKTHSPMSPETCKAASDYLNDTRFTWRDCRNAIFNPLTFTFVCTDWQQKYVCSDEWVTAPVIKKNSEECTGSACRCPGPGCKYAANRQPYVSYFRKYEAKTSRQKVSAVPTDLLAVSASSAGGGGACTAEKDALAQAQNEFAIADAAYRKAVADYQPKIDAYKSGVIQLTALYAAIEDIKSKLANPVPPAGMSVADYMKLLQASLASYAKQLGELIPKVLKLQAEATGLEALVQAAEDKMHNARQRLLDAESALDACLNGKPIAMPVACYGNYEEFDTRKKTTVQKDMRCVIRFPFTADELRTSQSGKGTYGVTAADFPQVKRNTSYNDGKDLWYPNVSDSMSLLSDSSFEQNYGNDLSQALLSPDKSDIRAYPQRSSSLYATTSTVRAFDETVSKSADASLNRNDERSLTTWWQRMETDADRLFSPPAVRLRLPDTVALSVQDLPSASGSVIHTDPRTQSIDVQLRAGDDLLGEVAGFLQKSLLLQVREEPVPVVVPLGSPLDFRADAERWKGWRAQRKLYGLAPVPEVDALILQLEEYAVQIERVRQLRSELARYIGGVIDHQQEVLININTWVQQNLDVYKSYLKNREARLSLRGRWVAVQQEYLKFHDDINMPWCRNDRFTTPVYSMLDFWYRGQHTSLSAGIPQCGTAVGGGLPLLCVPQAEEDMVFDLSNLRVMTGALAVPVLKPTQLSLAIPLPGPVDEEMTADQKKSLLLPDLPLVPTIDTAIIDALPTVKVESMPPTIVPPTLLNTLQANLVLNQSQFILQNMNKTYQKFWDSLAPTDTTRKLECNDWADGSCIHVETDLMERFTRIMARPAVLLKEDLQSLGAPRARISGTGDASVTCNPADHACVTLKQQRTVPKDGWQIVPPRVLPDEQNVIDALRTGMRRKTLQDNLQITNGVPYISSPEDILPIYTVPESLDLRPPKL